MKLKSRHTNKLFPVLLAALMLFSVMQITLSAHYCRGKLIATKVSLTGELASCSMKHLHHTCSAGENHLQSGCCQNLVSVFATDHNYLPSHFRIITPTLPATVALPLLANVLSHEQIQTLLSSIYTNAGPPGNDRLHAVSLPDICVFRN